MFYVRSLSLFWETGMIYFLFLVVSGVRPEDKRGIPLNPAKAVYPINGGPERMSVLNADQSLSRNVWMKSSRESLSSGQRQEEPVLEIDTEATKQIYYNSKDFMTDEPPDDLRAEKVKLETHRVQEIKLPSSPPLSVTTTAETTSVKTRNEKTTVDDTDEEDGSDEDWTPDLIIKSFVKGFLSSSSKVFGKMTKNISKSIEESELGKIFDENMNRRRKGSNHHSKEVTFKPPTIPELVRHLIPKVTKLVSNLSVADETEQHEPVKQTQVMKQREMSSKKRRSTTSSTEFPLILDHSHEDDENIFLGDDTDDFPIERAEGLPTNDIMSGVAKVAAEGLKEILSSPETMIGTFSLLNSFSSMADSSSSDQGTLMLQVMRPILNGVLNSMTKRKRKVSKERRIPGSKRFVDRHESHKDQVSLRNQVIPLLREAVVRNNHYPRHEISGKRKAGKSLSSSLMDEFVLAPAKSMSKRMAMSIANKVVEKLLELPSRLIINTAEEYQKALMIQRMQPKRPPMTSMSPTQLKQLQWAERLPSMPFPMPPKRESILERSGKTRMNSRAMKPYLHQRVKETTTEVVTTIGVSITTKESKWESPGFITGITALVIVIVLAVVGFILWRRKQQRGDMVLSQAQFTLRNHDDNVTRKEYY